MRGLALRKKDKNLKETAELFIELIDSEWSAKVSAAAIRSLNENTFNKQPILPITSDLVKLQSSLLRKIPLATEILTADPFLSNWCLLSDLAAS